MKKLLSSHRRFLRCARGATAIEYALLVSLISVGLISALNQISGSTNNAFNTIGTELEQH